MSRGGYVEVRRVTYLSSCFFIPHVILIRPRLEITKKRSNLDPPTGRDLPFFINVKNPPRTKEKTTAPSRSTDAVVSAIVVIATRPVSLPGSVSRARSGGCSGGTCRLFRGSGVATLHAGVMRRCLCCHINSVALLRVLSFRRHCGDSFRELFCIIDTFF